MEKTLKLWKWAGPMVALALSPSLHAGPPAGTHWTYPGTSIQAHLEKQHGIPHARTLANEEALALHDFLHERATAIVPRARAQPAPQKSAEAAKSTRTARVFNRLFRVTKGTACPNGRCPSNHYR